MSAAAKQRLAIIEQAYTNGEISRREYDERRRSYEYFGQREAAGYPAFDLRY